jgi:hypothetical protein
MYGLGLRFMDDILNIPQKARQRIGRPRGADPSKSQPV